MRRLTTYTTWTVGIWLGEVAMLAQKPVDDALIEGLMEIIYSQMGDDLISIVWLPVHAMMLCTFKHKQQADWLHQSWDAVVDVLEASKT